MLDDSLMNSVRTEAVRQKRSVEDQIAHWVKIGEAVEESPSYNYANIQAVFDGKKTHEELKFEEYQVWFDEVMKKMDFPFEKEKAYFTDMRRKGLSAGLDQNGNLVLTKV